MFVHRWRVPRTARRCAWMEEWCAGYYEMLTVSGMTLIRTAVRILITRKNGYGDARETSTTDLGAKPPPLPQDADQSGNGTGLSRHAQASLCQAVPRVGNHRLADRKSTRLNSSHLGISYAVFC